MPIIINELHTELIEPATAEATDQSDSGDSAAAALEPDLAMQRAAALLAERSARLEDD
jgi:hypothetical protein